LIEILHAGGTILGIDDEIRVRKRDGPGGDTASGVGGDAGEAGRRSVRLRQIVGTDVEAEGCGCDRCVAQIRSERLRQRERAHHVAIGRAGRGTCKGCERITRNVVSRGSHRSYVSAGAGESDGLLRARNIALVVGNDYARITRTKSSRRHADEDAAIVANRQTRAPDGTIGSLHEVAGIRSGDRNVRDYEPGSAVARDCDGLLCASGGDGLIAEGQGTRHDSSRGHATYRGVRQ